MDPFNMSEILCTFSRNNQTLGTGEDASNESIANNENAD